MPEVTIPEGSRFVEVEITGSDHNDSGSMFVYARGFNELEIPLEIGDRNFQKNEEKFVSKKRDNRAPAKPQEGASSVGGLTFDETVDSDVVVVR
jgi:hypothetical protein